MKSQKNIALFLFVLLGVFTVTNFFHRPIQTSVETPKVSAATKQSPPPTVPKAYNYVAQPGDSYTVLARKAIQTYGIVYGIKLSLAQIVAAETNLATQAGSPLLDAGQKVSIGLTDIKAAIDATRKLSAAELANWQAYVTDVDFNTNKAGQAS
jgi:hypothetical protein